MLSHELFNKLSIIVSSCDLLEEQEDPARDTGRHLTRIRNPAQAMTEKLREHQCRLALLPESEDPLQKEHVKQVTVPNEPQS